MIVDKDEWCRLKADNDSVKVITLLGFLLGFMVGLWA